MKGAVHYAPGDGALCGSDCPDGTRCTDCLERAGDDRADGNEYGGRCLHCRREITAQGGVAGGGRRAGRTPTLRAEGR